jgi:16S rRNA (guanine(966)-N(2))-methyltransferase RsmD
MRIIAGSLKRRRLKTPSWDGLRPTSDKLRETLFNILGGRVHGARVLDGFAGTGAVGIEAISRGAVHVAFVEFDRRATALIRENLASAGVREGYTIYGSDLLSCLQGLPSGVEFDVLVLDPPYDWADVEPVLEAAGRRVAAGGVLVLEHSRRKEPRVPASLTRVRDVKSGDSILTFFTARAAARDDVSVSHV